MIDTPSVIRVPAQRAAVARITVPRSEIQAVMGAGREELMAALAARGITPAGPWFSHHLRM
ncbi:MAG TPA: hypothetical protein VE913_09470, partial [Longimicrobium sp.]|nr:hypothetical protein [Longimicrobium sp.]